jgi:hypothetical protein
MERERGEESDARVHQTLTQNTLPRKDEEGVMSEARAIMTRSTIRDANGWDYRKLYDTYKQRRVKHVFSYHAVAVCTLCLLHERVQHAQLAVNMDIGFLFAS